LYSPGYGMIQTSEIGILTFSSNAAEWRIEY